MSTHKKPNKLRVAPSNAVVEIETLIQSLGFAAALPKAQQNMMRNRADAVPTVVTNLLANLAEQHGGAVAGMPFDAAAVRSALARADHAHAIAKAAMRLARRALSEAIRNRAIVSDRSMAVQLAMSRIVRLPEGEAFVEANGQVRALMRTLSKSGRSRKVAPKAAAPSTTISTPSNGAVIAKPAVIPSAAQPS